MKITDTDRERIKKITVIFGMVLLASVFFFASSFAAVRSFRAAAEATIAEVSGRAEASGLIPPKDAADAGTGATSDGESGKNADAPSPEPAALSASAEAASDSTATLPVNYAAAYEDKLPIPSVRKPYYIRINCTANTVNVFTLDENGEYTVPYKVMVCSTGDDTPKEGAYRLGTSHRWHTLFGGVYGQYTVEIIGNILFHSVPYREKGNPASLEYWEFDKLGTSASAGCVRLQVIDAKWIYENRRYVQLTEFYCSDDPGPLGKPSSPVISGNVYCRDWDPTDPDEDNLWFR